MCSAKIFGVGITTKKFKGQRLAQPARFSKTAEMRQGFPGTGWPGGGRSLVCGNLITSRALHAKVRKGQANRESAATLVQPLDGIGRY